MVAEMACAVAFFRHVPICVGQCICALVADPATYRLLDQLLLQACQGSS